MRPAEEGLDTYSLIEYVLKLVWRSKELKGLDLCWAREFSALQEKSSSGWKWNNLQVCQNMTLRRHSERGYSESLYSEPFSTMSLLYASLHCTYLSLSFTRQHR